MLSVCQVVYNCIVDECADGWSRTRQYPSQTQVSRKRIWMPDMAGGRGMERSEGCVSQDDGDSRTPVETVGVLLCIVRARGCSTVTPLNCHNQTDISQIYPSTAVTQPSHSYIPRRSFNSIVLPFQPILPGLLVQRKDLTHRIVQVFDFGHLVTDSDTVKMSSFQVSRFPRPSHLLTSIPSPKSSSFSGSFHTETTTIATDAYITSN